MIEIIAIQAGHGDALLVNYGDPGNRRHILIDGGTAASTVPLRNVLAAQRVDGRLRLEALIVTHYDLDHIDGILGLLKDKPDWLDICDIWFNGRKHLLPGDSLGSQQGDELTKLIERGGHPWNHGFSGRAVKQGEYAVLPGNLEIWVLSPDQRRLSDLADAWVDDNGPPPQDDDNPEPDLLGRGDQWPPLGRTRISRAPNFAKIGPSRTAAA